MTVKVHLDEENIKDACREWVGKDRQFEGREVADVTICLEELTNPTPGDQGAGFYAEVIFK